MSRKPEATLLADKSAIHDQEFTGTFHEILECEVTIPNPTKRLIEVFHGCVVDSFVDIYHARTDSKNNGTKKMRVRSGSIETGHKKGVTIDKEIAEKYPTIRTRMEKGIHVETDDEGVKTFLKKQHTRGAPAIRSIVKERRALMEGNVQLACTQLVEASLILKGTNSWETPVTIDLRHTRPYIDVETEASPDGFNAGKTYEEIKAVLDKWKIPTEKTSSISTRGLIVRHLSELSNKHSLFAVEDPEQAPFILAQCLRCDLGEVFKQKGIPNRWKGK